MKKQKKFLTLLLILCAWPGASTLQAQSSPGTVVAWDAYSELMPVPVEAQGGVTAIAAGWSHIMALKTDGSVVAWGGWNENGETTVPVAAQSKVTAIAAGGGFCCLQGFGYSVALKNDGSVVAWGNNDFGQTAVPAGLNSVVAIAAGGFHAVALKSDGTVAAWGRNDLGQVTGNPTADYPYFATASPVTLGGQVLSGVTAIAAGVAHTVALKNDGSVVAWRNIGNATVPIAAQSGVMAIAAGWSHTVALKNDGTVVAWGNNDYGQTVVPAGLSEVTAIAAGRRHTVVLKNDGTVVTWGSFNEGTVPAGLAGVTAISAGAYRTVALLGTVPLLPYLDARPNGKELILSWPTNAPGFTLQLTPNITPPVTWMDSTNAPVVIGAQFTVTNATSGPAQFYRLRKP